MRSVCMRSVWWCALAALASTFVLNHAARAADLPTAEPAARLLHLAPRAARASRSSSPAIAR